LKLRADEHVSQEIVRAVREMALSPGWELSHVVEEGDRGSSDEHWITRFAAQGGNAILSADTDFFLLPVQVMAVFNTGMKVIHFPSRWANAGCSMQAAHTLLWWGRIEKKIAEMRQRQCFRPPWNVGESGDLSEVRIDYQSATKKLKKANRRAA
jgi:hypothetical protein